MEHSPVGMAIVSPTGDLADGQRRALRHARPRPRRARHDVLPGRHPPRRPRRRPARWSSRRSRARSAPTASPSATSAPTARSWSATCPSRCCATRRQPRALHRPGRRHHRAPGLRRAARRRRGRRGCRSGVRRRGGLRVASASGCCRSTPTGATWPTQRPQREFLDLAFPDGHGGRAGQAGCVFDADERLLAHEDMPSARATRGEELEDVRSVGRRGPATRAGCCRSRRAPVHDRIGRARRARCWPTTTSPT